VTETPGTTITGINFGFKQPPPVDTPTTLLPNLDPINQSVEFTYFALQYDLWSGGREPDWLVGSDVFRVLEAGIPGTANVSADVFYGSAPRKELTYEATSIDGDPLPTWLFFDPSLLRFDGTPPDTMEGSVDVRVIATDRHGRQATAEVHIVVLQEPADIVAMLHPARPLSEQATAPSAVPLTIDPSRGRNGPQTPPVDTPLVIPQAGSPPAPINDRQPTPPGGDSRPTPPNNDNAPAPRPSPTQGTLRRPVGKPLAARDIQGFGLSPQLREQSLAGRLAKSRMLLNALSSERRAAL
jgi:hypothetical protein